MSTTIQNTPSNYASIAKTNLHEAQLKITILCFPASSVIYEGTKKDLIDEGVIPLGLTFPEKYQQLEWVTGQLEYTLVRSRPANAKGPRKQFEDTDWWRLQSYKKGPKDYNSELIKKKKKELEQAIKRNTPAGREQERIHFERFYRAHADKEFQAFKSKIHALHPKSKRSK